MCKSIEIMKPNVHKYKKYVISWIKKDFLSQVLHQAAPKTLKGKLFHRFGFLQWE